MAFKFPFSTLHELNLDWILEKVKELVANNEEFNDKADYAVQTADEAKEIAEDAMSAILPDGSVTTQKIADYAVTQNKLAVNAVGNYQLQAGSVTTAKIADEAVTTAKIDDEAVTTAKIADEAVTTAKIADEAVTTAKIDDEAVTTAKIADDAVTTAKISDGNVTKAKLNTDITTRSTTSVTDTITGLGTATINFQKVMNVVQVQFLIHITDNYSAARYTFNELIPAGYRPKGVSFVTAYVSRTDGNDNGIGAMLLWDSGTIEYGALKSGTSGVDLICTTTYLTNV